MRRAVVRIVIGLAGINLILALLIPISSILVPISDSILGLTFVGALLVGWSSKNQGKHPIASGATMGLIFSVIAYFHELIHSNSISRAKAIRILKSSHEIVTSNHIHNIMSVDTHLSTRFGGYILAIIFITFICIILAWLGSLFGHHPEHSQEEVY